MKNKEMFLAMRNIFYGGEFSHWLNEQSFSMGADKEYQEALEYFEKMTGFNCETGEVIENEQT